jgi:hypothetical protein
MNRLKWVVCALVMGWLCLGHVAGAYASDADDTTFDISAQVPDPNPVIVNQVTNATFWVGAYDNERGVEGWPPNNILMQVVHIDVGTDGELMDVTAEGWGVFRESSHSCNMIADDLPVTGTVVSVSARWSTSGKKQVECEGYALYDDQSRDDDDDTVDVAVVGISSLQYQIGSSAWTMVPGTDTGAEGVIYVPKGTPINFKAIATPNDGGWPSGKPVWTDATPVENHPDQATRTFGIASANPTDYKANVSAECGNTKIAHVVVLWLDLDADTNRDGNITDADEEGENTWSQGPTGRGAIILPNCDKDGIGTIGPDNWPGGDWDMAVPLGDEPPNTKVDGGNDKSDIGRLYMPKFGLNPLPANLKITLSLAKVAGEHPFIAGVDAKRRVRIFLPTDTIDNDLDIKAGDNEIIGPSTSDTVDFVALGGGGQNINIFQGAGTVKFGIEGIEFGAMVDVTMTAKIGATTIATDTVRVRVAPYVLMDHTSPVPDPVHDSRKAVYIWDDGSIATGYDNNFELRSKLGTAYGAQLLATTTADEWHQDGYEVGYAKAPYGSLPVFLVSPRATGNGDLLRKFVHNTILGTDVGVCNRIENVGLWRTYDSLGNLEAKPESGKQGKWFYGKSLHDDIEAFFNAQSVNAPVAGDVNTDWLSVGHVDEVISFAPDGQRTIVADSELGWALLVWAKKIDGTKWMHQHMNGNGGGGIQVKDVIDADSGIPVIPAVSLRDFNLLSSNAAFVMHNDNLPQIRNTKLNLPSPIENLAPDVGNTGTGGLVKAGAFVSFFPNNNKKFYRVTFTSATDYALEFKEQGGAWALAGDTGKTTEDSVFPDAKCFIFKHWWSGDPKYVTATATITGVVNSIQITNGGTGYTSAPNVAITGGGGTGAMAEADVAGGAVINIRITNAGSGYTGAPTIAITGDGTNATATASIMNVVNAINVTDGGSGFSSAPVVTFSGGGGTGAAATATVEGGVVTAINVTNGGSGYTSAPKVLIGDKFAFTADPTCKTIEMPVIFKYLDMPDPFHDGAIAYTMNHVNSFVDDSGRVVTGRTYGPNVAYDGGMDKDILGDYVWAAFQKAGFTNRNEADSRYYHNRDGDIHCGTNVRREVPAYNWWEN